MKKVTYLIMGVVVVFLATRFVFADGMKGSMKEDGMEGKGMMKMMHKMHGMTRSSMMVASNDGGVIVLSGNGLYKYDKNLKLVGEAEVKMGKDGMGMGMKDCPMMGKGKKKTCCQGKKMMGQDDTDDAAEGEAVQPAQEESEHERHH